MPKFNRHRNRANRRNLLAAQNQLRKEGLISKFENPSFEQIKVIRAKAEFEKATRGTKGAKPMKITAKPLLNLEVDRVEPTRTTAPSKKVQAALQPPKPKAGSKPPSRKALKGKSGH